MAIQFIKTTQRGEWFAVGGRLTNAETDAAVDVTGRVVTLSVRTGPTGSDLAVTVDGATGTVIDGPGGVVEVGGRIATAGVYYATMAVGTSADGSGWPVKERFTLKVTDCP